MWAGKSLADWSGQLVEELVRIFEPVEVWLFGSVARGDDGPDSDLDLLVVLGSYDPAAATNLKQKAASQCLTPVPFDVAFTDEIRFHGRARIAGTLERAAATNGRLLYRRGR